MGYKIHLCDDFSSVDFIYLILFFFKDSLDLNAAWFAEGIFSLTKIAMEIGKDIFSVMTVTIAKRENASSETWTL